MPEASTFDALTREFFSVWFRFHPEAALAVGVDEYGDLLAPQSDDDHAALGSWLETLVVALEELDHDALDPARRLDAELLFSLARVEHEELLEHDWRRRDPLRHLPLDDIHRLTLLRPPALRDDLLKLLRLIPAHLRLASTQLATMAELIPPPVVAAAIDATDAGPAYLRELARSRWLRMHCNGCGEIETAAEDAAAALLQFAKALRETIAPRAAGRCGCGADQLRFLLRHRHRLPVEPRDCADVLERLARRLPAPNPDADATPASDTNRGIGAECARQRELIATRGLFSLPAAELHIAGGPACPRFAGAMAAGAARLDIDGPGLDYMPDLTRGRGALYVADGQQCGAVPPEVMRRRCLGLGWGGLHTLTFAGGIRARSLPRLLADGTSLHLGLALVLAGRLFGEDAPATAASRRRAVDLARLDLALHLGELDAATAHKDAAALGEPNHVLAALIRRPGEALAAVLGWRLLQAAEDRLRDDAGSAFDTRSFFDGLVSNGPVPAATALAAHQDEALVTSLLAKLCVHETRAPERH